MPEAPPLSQELAFNIENMVAAGASNGFVENQKASERDLVQFGQTVAVRTKTGHPNNSVFCFGQEDLKHLKEILAFYAPDNLQPTFRLSPMRFTKGLADALAAEGFQQTDFGLALLYGATEPHSGSLPADVSVEPVTRENFETFITTSAEANQWPDTWREGGKQGIRKAGLKPECHRFLARYKGEPAGVGCLGRVGKIASLGGAAVIPQFRKKGCHSALFHHRLQLAHQWGCFVAIATVKFGSASFHNQQRLGFRLAYIESAWKRTTI